jgi:phosphoglycolate phosphatase-like HAD superfamily hydrolase
MSQSGLLFDLDGTILDTSPDFVACLNQLLEQVGKPLVPDHKIRQTVSLGVKGLIKLGLSRTIRLIKISMSAF